MIVLFNASILCANDLEDSFLITHYTYYYMN